MSASAALRRLTAELKEMREDPDASFTAEPLEDNMLEWHFTIAGPPDSPFAGGAYHGRIILPPEYPFRPPNVVFLTPNGRWMVNTKICLNASAYHPEEWKPSWGIKTLLIALMAYMPMNGEGAVGAVEMPADERRRLSEASRTWKCPNTGPAPEAHNAQEQQPLLAQEAQQQQQQNATAREQAREERSFSFGPVDIAIVVLAVFFALLLYRKMRM
eukprot:m51a1_g8693 putative C-tail anchored protein, ubiquitin-conjugating enzyme (215) ;mRNA; f:48418-49577